MDYRYRHKHKHTSYLYRRLSLLIYVLTLGNIERTYTVLAVPLNKEKNENKHTKSFY